MCMARDFTSMEIQHYCPECDEETTFHLMASVELHLGRKTKWYCGECDYELVKIDDDIDTAEAPA